MTENLLKNLYNKKPGDKVFGFDDKSGFTLISDYPEAKFQGRKVLLKMYFSEGLKIAGRVGMVKEADEDGHYPLTEPEPGEPRVTDFYFSDEGFEFDIETNKILSRKTNKLYTIDSLVDLIIDVHANKNVVGYIDLVKRFLSKKLLVLIYWLVEESYHDEEFDALLRCKQYAQSKQTKVRDFDPFFKFFRISKNILFILTTIYVLAIVCVKVKVEEFSIPDITNSLLVVMSFLIFLSAEKLSTYLDSVIKIFRTGEHNKLKEFENIQFGYKVKSFDLEKL